MLIVRGTGRNVGKTLSACNIIKQLAEKHNPVGVKISPHFHSLDGIQDCIHKSEKLIIVEEKNISGKDSSRMLQAGAKKVFYIQAKNDQLPEAINLLSVHLNPYEPVVVESGGLYDYIEPSLLITIIGNKNGKEINIRNSTNALNLPSAKVHEFMWNSIQFKNRKITFHA